MHRISLGRSSLAAAVFGGVVALGLTLSLVSCGRTTEAQTLTPQQKVERGRYLVKIGGCNDCHTQGFIFDEKIPEKDWLLGDSMGWKSPLGTAYGSNLRKVAAQTSEEMFIKSAKSRKNKTGLPPMPWSALEAMTDQDVGAIYAYLKNLGDGGIMAPSPLKPGEEPKGPYIDMMPKNLPAPPAATGPK